MNPWRAPQRLDLRCPYCNRAYNTDDIVSESLYKCYVCQEYGYKNKDKMEKLGENK